MFVLPDVLPSTTRCVFCQALV